MNEKLSGCKYVYSELLCRKREKIKINMSHRFSLQEKTIQLMSNKKSLNRFLRVRIQQLKSCKKLKLNANNCPFCFVSILVARAKMIYDLFFQKWSQKPLTVNGAFVEVIFARETRVS